MTNKKDDRCPNCKAVLMTNICLLCGYSEEDEFETEEEHRGYIG